jgi:hypothetical protein
VSYTRVTDIDRSQIYVLRQAEKGVREIARLLLRTASTISREVFRNTGGKGYCPSEYRRTGGGGRRPLRARAAPTSPSMLPSLPALGLKSTPSCATMPLLSHEGTIFPPASGQCCTGRWLAGVLWYA